MSPASQPWTPPQGLVVPIDRANVDTDAIIPKQFMKSIRRTGYGDNLFDEWRYLDAGEPGQDCTHRPRRPDFVLNQPRYSGASVLLARNNFGCGSSREHAVWALRDAGIRALVAPGFADIFEGNCLKNGLLPIVLDEAVVQVLFEAVHARPGYSLVIDLAAQTVTRPGGEVLGFVMDAGRKQRLMEGLDDIAITLQHRAAIEAHERQRILREPWLQP
jgi:3-isopropylmalate/(R)-2-methylmalate dehydratase small subunit